MNSKWLVKQILQLLYDSYSRCGLVIEVHDRNQSNKSKLVLYNLLLSL